MAHELSLVALRREEFSWIRGADIAASQHVMVCALQELGSLVP